MIILQRIWGPQQSCHTAKINVLDNGRSDPFLALLASWPPPAANAHPSGLKRHSRGKDAFKEGLGGIQEELMRTDIQIYYVLYNIDNLKLLSFKFKY